MSKRTARANARGLPKSARATSAKRKGSQSLYEKYPLPFFDRERRLTWAAKPTGRYDEDCKTGRAFAIEFLKSNDGTNGWAALLGPIVTDMINAGPMATRWADGEPHANGLVIGFMGMLGAVLCATATLSPAIIGAISAHDDCKLAEALADEERAR